MLTDNGQGMPAYGIVKMAGQRPNEVEFLFRDALVTDNGGDMVLLQTHTDQFLDGIEAIRL